MGSELLSGFRMLDLADEKGALCAKIFADLGADVIKIEPPQGCSTRRIPPFVDDLPDAERSFYFIAYQAGKRSVTLNLDSPDGRVLLEDLVRKSDFLLESFPVGYMESIGLGYERLAELNLSLRAELDLPLCIGIGVHCGPVIVGEMGYGTAAAITAIGDAVNTASRLETLTKNFACELVVSDETVSRAGLDLSGSPLHEMEIRGKREMLAVRTLVSATELPAALLPTSTGRPRHASNGSPSPSIQTNSNG